MVAVAYVNESKYIMLPIPEYMFVFAGVAHDNFLVEPRGVCFGSPLWCGCENRSKDVWVVHVSTYVYICWYTV